MKSSIKLVLSTITFSTSLGSWGGSSSPSSSLGTPTSFTTSSDHCERNLLSSYTCPNCGHTSYNPNDVYHRYCGNCNKRHSECHFNGLIQGRPLWVKSCTKERRLWVEDDALPMDKHSLDRRWREFFGEERPKEHLLKHDEGDCFFLLYPKWRVALISGVGDTAIYQLRPEDTWQKS
jgi:hypothetical protein